MKRIYIFSGLGTDKRVFQKMDFTTYNTIFIDWISPNKNESIFKTMLFGFNAN